MCHNATVFCKTILKYLLYQLGIGGKKNKKNNKSIDPLQESSCFGIDIYTESLQIVVQKLGQYNDIGKSVGNLLYIVTYQ